MFYNSPRRLKKKKPSWSQPYQELSQSIIKQFNELLCLIIQYTSKQLTILARKGKTSNYKTQTHQIRKTRLSVSQNASIQIFNIQRLPMNLLNFNSQKNKKKMYIYETINFIQGTTKQLFKSSLQQRLKHKNLQLRETSFQFLHPQLTANTYRKLNLRNQLFYTQNIFQTENKYQNKGQQLQFAYQPSILNYKQKQNYPMYYT
eukprot:TRINITY_DN10297_c0_g1_i1.p1 TRINITY_DN10297_c0_g1~~TRINITY_DN10297_c0_g1_i1.p1  ORF type:complete len:210 (-),score=-13.78 TRINITY_DN10297_c0_g1_i1:390-998(-)